MGRSGKFVGFLAVMSISFFMTVFFTVPLVQSMWNMLVMPSYPHILPSGYVYFVILTSSLVKFKIGETKPLNEIAGNLVGYYITILITWVFANLYTNFL